MYNFCNKEIIKDYKVLLINVMISSHSVLEHLNKITSCELSPFKIRNFELLIGSHYGQIKDLMGDNDFNMMMNNYEEANKFYQRYKVKKLVKEIKGGEYTGNSNLILDIVFEAREYGQLLEKDELYLLAMSGILKSFDQ